MSIICPDCNKRTLTLNDSCHCGFCGAKFIKIGETVYVNEKAFQKAAKIAEETDKKLGEIIRERGVDDLVGNEGETAGVVSGRKDESTFVINDFLITGTPGPDGYFMDPIFALDENKEKSPLLSVIKRFYAETKIELPLSFLMEMGFERIREESEMDEENFAKELKRLIQAGQECKVGTFHSHETSAPFLSEQDIRIMKFSDELEDRGYGRNDCVEVIISGCLIVFEKVTARELGRIPLTYSCFFDENEL